MAETKIKYAADSGLAITLTGPLTTDAARASAVFDNTSTLYADVSVGGMIGSVGTTWAATESVDIYLIAQYSDTATDVGGGIGTGLGNGDADETADTDFVLANLPLVASIRPEITAPTTNQDYHWNCGSIAAKNGGVMPKKFSLLVHNNTGGSVDSGNINVVGVTYTTA